MSEGKTPTAAEMPTEAIVEAAKTFPECLLKVSRRNTKGQFEMIISNQVHAVADLLTIEDYMDKLCGGGAYRVEARNPSGTEPLFVVQPFNINVGGPSRPRPTVVAAQQAAAAGQGNFPGVAPAPMSYPQAMYGAPPPFDPSAMGYPQQMVAPLQVQAPMMPPPSYGLASPWGAPQARYASDQLALGQVASLERELGKLREEAKAERNTRALEAQRFEERMKEKEAAFQRELAEERRRREEEQRRADDQRRADERARQDQALAQMQANMNAQIAAIQQAAQQPKGPDLMTSLVPLVTAYLTTSKDREASQVSTQIELAKMQSASQQQMMQMFMKSSSGDKEQFELLKTILDQRGPDVQMQLMNGMLENQITSIGAMANLLKETAPEEPPIWMQAAMTGINAMQNIARDVLDQNRMKSQPQQLQSTNTALPQSPQFHQIAAPASVPGMYTPGDQVDGAPVVVNAQGQVVSGAAPAQQNGSPIPPDVHAAIAQQVDQLAPMLPSDFQTLEWRAILIALHAQADVEYSAHLLSKHLGHLMEFRGLPAGFSEFTSNPKSTLYEILRFLPIGQQAPAYAKAVIETTVAYLVEEGYLPRARSADGSDDDEEDGDEEDDTEHPANGGLHRASGFSSVPSQVQPVDDSAQLRGRA